MMRVPRIDFHTTKYGPELLVDTAWVHDMPTFLFPGPHTLAFYDILLVTAGRGWFWLDAHRHAVRPNEVFFTTPGQIRRWQVRELDGLCLFFPAVFLEEFFNDPLFLHRLPFFHIAESDASLRLRAKPAAALRRTLLGMRRELRHLRSDSVHLLRARLYQVLIQLARGFSRDRKDRTQPVPNQLTLRFRELIAREAIHHHGVEHYAGELGVSPGHLNVLSRKHLGRGAKEVIEDRLSVLARRLLLYSDKTAAEVGYVLGFRDPSYFTRFFRRENGRSPTAFRREHRQPATG